MNTIRPGMLVYWRDSPAVVMELKGLTEAILRLVDSNKTGIAHVTELTTSPPSEQPTSRHHLLAKDKEWDKALERYELIKPLLENPQRTSEDVINVARTANKSTVTIYRWINRFNETGLVSSLLRAPRGDKGSPRIDVETQQIIDQQIESFFLKKERPSVSQLYERIKHECYSIDIQPPHRNTVYSRVRDIEGRKAVSRRYSPKQAREAYEPVTGKFPDADYPNAVIQIDHTKVDVIVVDEEHRLPIGRPFLTIGIDVATKMISGFCMTLDPPSALSAGLCIAQSVGRKEHWLAKRDITAEWPFYGKMSKIHVDNAKEFSGGMLLRACENHGITHELRPKGQPNYGPHVERAFRTFMEECHRLPGTTFSNISKKLEYDSEGNACLTLSELDLWFTVYIVHCYHHKKHRGICDIPPIKLYNQYVHGTSERLGVGLPAPIGDEEKFKLDFTPYVERTIQRSGVVIDNVHYYSPVLRKWINAKEPGAKQKKKFIFARDPRDISVVYFLDPDSESYVPIPYLNNTRPAVSLWELRAVIKKVREDEAYQVDEEVIFQGIKRMREIEESAVEKTRLAKQQRATEKRKRRMSARRTGWQNIHPTEKVDEVVTDTYTEQEDDLDVIEPFNDIQVK